MINLFGQNFDLEAKRTVHKESAATAQATADLKEQLEVARKQGFDAGRDLGRKEAKTEFEAAAQERLESERQIIQDQLAQMVQQDNQQQAETERDIVELFLGIADRLAPELTKTYGTQLAIDRIRHAVQQVRSDPALSIRAHADVIAALQSESATWLATAGQNARIDLHPDAAMARGAAQVRWNGGRLEYDIEAACDAIREALAEAAEHYNEATQKAG